MSPVTIFPTTLVWAPCGTKAAQAGVCTACEMGPSRLEVHHVVKRAQGGSDFDLDRLVALCPRCHAQTDAPYLRGRLLITPLGGGRFTIEAARGADKWAIRASPPAVDGVLRDLPAPPRVSEGSKPRAVASTGGGP